MTITISKQQIEMFYDNLKLYTKGDEASKVDSKFYLMFFVNTILNSLEEGEIVHFGDEIFESIDEFNKWLYNDYNKKLGTENLKYIL